MPKILIVEDEVSLKDALSSKLRVEGMDVFGAANGEEGFTLALAQKPDLIVLDLLMPKMGGIEMLTKVRESSDWGKHVAVLILTNQEPNDTVIKDLVQTDPVYYLLKAESSLEEVLAKIKEVLARPVTPAPNNNI